MLTVINEMITGQVIPNINKNSNRSNVTEIIQ